MGAELGTLNDSFPRQRILLKGCVGIGFTIFLSKKQLDALYIY